MAKAFPAAAVKSVLEATGRSSWRQRELPAHVAVYCVIALALPTQSSCLEVVRVIDYRLEGVAGAEPMYRLVTTIFDPEKAPAPELAALYHERWEIDTKLVRQAKFWRFYIDARFYPW